MELLSVAVILVGILCLLDLALTVGVIRRLRVHSELLSSQAEGFSAVPSVGDEVGEFQVITVEGDVLSRESFLIGERGTLLAFLAPSCEPCREKLPKLVEYAKAEAASGGSRVVVAIIGDADEAAAFVEELRPVAHVVVEQPGEALNLACNVNAYPTVLRVVPDEADKLIVAQNQVELDHLSSLTA